MKAIEAPPAARAALLALLLCSALLLLLAAPSREAAEPVSVAPFTAHEIGATRIALAQKGGTNYSIIQGPAGAEWQLQDSLDPEAEGWHTALTGGEIIRNVDGLELRGLQPSTLYHVRILAIAGGESAERTAEFKTTAPASPLFLDPHAPRFDYHESAPTEFVPQCRLGTPNGVFCTVGEIQPSPTSYHLATEAYADGADTAYRFEYSTSEEKLLHGEGEVLAADSGTVSQGEERKTVPVDFEGLAPETRYYLRATGENAAGAPTHTAPIHFTTHTDHAQVTEVEAPNPSADSAHLRAFVQPNGHETHWRFEYSESESGPWSGGPEGTISLSEAAYPAQSTVEGLLGGLQPSHRYYLRLAATNAAGGQTEQGCVGSYPCSFVTSGPPNPDAFATHTFHGEALDLLGYLEPNDSGLNAIQTIALGGSPGGGAFTLTSAGLADAATGTGQLAAGSTKITKITTTSGRFAPAEPISGPGIPAATTIVQARSEPTEVNGELGPAEFVITLSKPATASSSSAPLTAAPPPIPVDASATQVDVAVGALPGFDGNIRVFGPDGGPWKVEYVNGFGSSDRPLLEADASGLTPSGTVAVSTAQQGFSYHTHYFFEYIAEEAFQADGESFGEGTRRTPEVQYQGAEPGYLEADLPTGLAPGAYRYRLTAANTTPGETPVHSSPQALAVPSAAAQPQAACPNEAFRSGPSAALPDCRAYEQLTPHDKEGAEEVFHDKQFKLENAGVVVGEDGDHLEFDGRFVHWGGSGSPYFFSRRPDGSWQTTGATVQPEAGLVTHYAPQLYAPELTSFAFAAGWKNTDIAESPDLAFQAGPPGGPYALASDQPRAKIEQGAHEHSFNGWVAASDDFSKLILKTEDRKLAGRPTATTSGADLYEYARGAFRQANVTGAEPASTIGHCGAEVARGDGERLSHYATSTRHSLSADGQRLFFYADPGAACPSVTEWEHQESPDLHLYLRTTGEGAAHTTDLGPLRFLAANPTGSEALLEARSGAGGETQEFLLYDTESNTSKLLFSKASETLAEELPGPDQAALLASTDLSAIYLSTPQRLSPEAPPAGRSSLYRYDVASQTMRFVLPDAFPVSLSPDGRYAYLTTSAVVPFASFKDEALRYDAATGLVQCLACVSTSGPAPTGGFLYDEVESETRNNSPGETVAAANGDFAFFNSCSPLVAKDANGDCIPSPGGGKAGSFSPSGDVYEWRRPGLDGCAHPQGCLALISSGGAGRIVSLLGTAHQGRDVFFSSAAPLGPNDEDSSLDIYDARIGGGEPPAPPRPVECEGDACSTPVAPPSDLTPSSSTFQGAGNVLAAGLREVNAKPKPAPKKKTKCKVKGKKKCKAKAKQKAGKRAKRAVRNGSAGR